MNKTKLRLAWQIGMVFLLSFFLQNIAFAAASELECNVGGILPQGETIELDRPIETCARMGQCQPYGSVVWMEEHAELFKTAGGCGYKSSELKITPTKMTGRFVDCANEAQDGQPWNPDAQCHSRKSKDGKYDLMVCHQTGKNKVYTFAFPANSKDRSKGKLVISNIGNSASIGANELSCGPSRQSYPLSGSSGSGSKIPVFPGNGRS